MKILWISLLHIFITNQCFAIETPTHLTSALKKPNLGFFTPKDLAIQNSSNIKLKNEGNTPRVVYGIYIRQFASVEPGQSCAQAAPPMYPSSDNVAAGAVVMPIPIGINSAAPIGENYLYNMIYGAIYYVAIQSGTPACRLPGCTWETDPSIYNWCIYLGALAPISLDSDHTSTVPPSTTVISGAGFNYNLVAQYGYIGPISCNDQTLTCSVATPQSQAFS